MIDAQRLEALKASGRLPGPSRTARELIQKLTRDDVALPEIVRLIQSDPALSGRLLRLANSAAYARPRPFLAVTPEVLMLLGLPLVRNLVLAFSLIDAERGGEADFDYLGFWSRSLAEACAAQTLSAFLRIVPPLEAFTLGLVSEIGQLALVDLEPHRYPALLAQYVGRDTEALIAAEGESLGLDHRELAAALLADWGFPKLFQDAVHWHDRPEECWPMEAGSRAGKLAALLTLAHRLADSFQREDAERLSAIEALQSRAAALGLIDLIALADEILRAWREWGELLAVPVAARPSHAELLAYYSKAPATMRVLVVEDDAVTQRLLTGVLTKAGYEVRCAADGEEGLALARAWLPEIIITDILMPKKNGLDLIEALRATSEGQTTYVIVVTILDSVDSLVQAFALGADDYVTKPIDARVLLARLQAGQRVIGLKRELIQRNLELAEALERAREAALTDVLTGLANRRYLMEQMQRECAAADRADCPLSVLMIDIDHFKRLNDEYGHDLGDAVLVEVARRLRATTRAADVVARMGGEEFLVLAPDTPIAAACRLAERIRQAIANQPFETDGRALSLSVSVGVAQKSELCQDIDQLLKRADAALYRAKVQGRNRVCSENDTSPRARPDERG